MMMRTTGAYAWALVIFWAVAPVANADVLLDRPFHAAGGWAQDFPDQPAHSTWIFDPFTVPSSASWDLTAARFFGSELPGGDIGRNVMVMLAISSTANRASLGDIALVSSGVENAAAVLTFDLTGRGIHLHEGNYFLSAWVVRPFDAGDGGQWAWGTADRATRSDQSIIHNPGGAFGLGTNPFPGERWYGGPFHQAVLLEGRVGGSDPDPMPEPSTVVLLCSTLPILTLCLATRRRRTLC